MTPITVALPDPLHEWVEAQTRTGRFGDVGDYVRELIRRDRELAAGGVGEQPEPYAAVERWLREDVVAGHAEYLADPSKGVPAEEILGRIKARRAAGAK